MAGYALTAGGYPVLTAVGLVTAKRAGRSAEVADVGPWDLVLTGLTTHKLSRMLAKDTVTSPLRVPCTRFQGVAGPAELGEDVRDGSREAIGELISCPFCLAQWVATGYAFGLVFASGSLPPGRWRVQRRRRLRPAPARLRASSGLRPGSNTRVLSRRG